MLSLKMDCSDGSNLQNCIKYRLWPTSPTTVRRQTIYDGKTEGQVNAIATVYLQLFNCVRAHIHTHTQKISSCIPCPLIFIVLTVSLESNYFCTGTASSYRTPWAFSLCKASEYYFNTNITRITYPKACRNITLALQMLQHYWRLATCFLIVLGNNVLDTYSFASVFQKSPICLDLTGEFCLNKDYMIGFF